MVFLLLCFLSLIHEHRLSHTDAVTLVFQRLGAGPLPPLHHLDRQLYLLLRWLGRRTSLWSAGVRRLERIRLLVGVRIALALRGLPLQSADGEKPGPAVCGLGVCFVSGAVHRAGHGSGFEGLSLLFRSKRPQLGHNLRLPLPPLSLQEMERLW